MNWVLHQQSSALVFDTVPELHYESNPPSLATIWQALVPLGEALAILVCFGYEVKVDLAYCAQCWGCKVVMHHECVGVAKAKGGVPWYCGHCANGLSSKQDVTMDRLLLE